MMAWLTLAGRGGSGQVHTPRHVIMMGESIAMQLFEQLLQTISQTKKKFSTQHDSTKHTHTTHIIVL